VREPRSGDTATTLDALLAEVRACRVCAPGLPHEPRPVLRVASSARLLIVGQAPGRRVHETGIPWNDPSGDRLRAWLGVSRERFYDERVIAIIPIGLCYPGTVDGADRPPRRECAPLWQARLRAHLPHVGLTLLVGSHAQAFHLAKRRLRTMTETVQAFERYLPDVLPLPHPSWRNTAWLARHPWFEGDVLPELRRRVATLLG
jgi:uracil-DNA glycosylase